jgi:uncharacterized RDD family membrane protein YckC
MQQAPAQEHVAYAGLGLRTVAVLIDGVVLFAVYLLVGTVWAFALVARQNVDPQDSAAVQALLNQQVQDVSTSTFYLVVFGSLFIYYLLLEAVFSASIGKLVLGMRVVMTDGSRATGTAVVLRNLVRVPEAMLLYIPAAFSCLMSSRRQRLGDRVARTVVVRRHREVTAFYGGQTGAPPAAQTPFARGPGGAPAPQAPAAPEAVWPAPSPAAPSQHVAAEPPAVETELARLKTAALAARGAHLSYLRFSERELAAGAGEHSGEYSEGYVSAWFTLTDAVAALRAARSGLEAATSAAGQTPEEVLAGQPDLTHLMAELAPYFAAADGDAVHAAFLEVARAESSS